jgi:glycosyltransferase involved in cell wall biosynthesis
MRCPTLNELPPPPPNKTGWPWLEESPPLPSTTTNGQPWPRVSIVTPSYNQAEFIEETIRSVLLQGYRDLEYIIIDGGSTDGSIEIIRKYESWVAYWVSESDRGQSHAINKGFKRASGDVASWLNSDDLLYQNVLGAIARAFIEHPDAGMIYGVGAKIDSIGQIIKKIPFRQHCRKLLRTRYSILQQSSFMRKEALLDVGFLDESIEYFIDWELSLRISLSYPIYAIPDDIGMFRIHPAAKTQKSGWDRKREIARIGRGYNGFTDRNFVTFWPLFLCHTLKKRTGWYFFTKIGRVLRRLFDIIYGADSYMMR